MLQMRHDVGPFGDVRVRRAMMMIIDHDEINQSLYGGKGSKMAWPVYPIPEWNLQYLPLEEYPRDVQELYEYHPDKARSLLAEAGYPDGFSTSVHINRATPALIELGELVKYYWEKVGVDLELKLVDNAIYNSMRAKKSYPHGRLVDLGAGTWREFTYTKVGSIHNPGMVNDPLVEELRPKILSLYFQPEELGRLYKEALPELQRQALHIVLPQPINYNMWQPWVEGYYGEVDTFRFLVYEQNVGEYVWINQDLKKELGR